MRFCPPPEVVAEPDLRLDAEVLDGTELAPDIADSGADAGGELDLAPDEVTPSPCLTDEDCDDGDKCSQDLCLNGVCEPVALPAGFCCTGAGDCDDHIACTLDECKSGWCFHTKDSNLCCADAGDCNDFNPCTLDLCVDNQCATVFQSSGDCVCEDVLDCGDGLDCTVDSCVGGVCLYEPAAGISGCCAESGQCADADPLTVDACIQYTCSNMAPPPCALDAHCDDADPCTDDSCVDERCVFAAVEGCCQLAGQCGDGLDATHDLCLGGQCVHSLTPEPIPCVDAAQCDDGSGCTTESCVSSACSVAPSGAAECCAAKAECDDGSPCTEDGCESWQCTHTPVAGPVPQVVWAFGPGGMDGFEVESDGSAVHWQLSQASYTSGPSSLYFGDVAGPTLDNGKRVHGTVTTPSVSLPQAGPVTLHGWTFIHCEPLVSRDQLFIWLDDGQTMHEIWSKMAVGGTTGLAWVEFEVSLTEWAGQEIQLVIGFDSIDAINNDYMGIYFDDLEFRWPCPAP